MTVIDREPAEPEDTLVRARWVRGIDREWVEKCDQILMEWGVVTSRTAYERRDTAKNRVRRLRELMTELRIHERWELVGRTERKGNGWIWHLEFVGDRDGTAENKHPAA